MWCHMAVNIPKDRHDIREYISKMEGDIYCDAFHLDYIYENRISLIELMEYLQRASVKLEYAYASY